LKKLGLLALLVVLTLIIIPTIVQADPWSAIDSGYAITTNHFGEEIVPPPDPPLQVKVGVLAENFYDPIVNPTGVYEVRVDLRDPDDTVVATDTILLADFTFEVGGSPQGADIYYAWTDDLVPATWVIGDYSVKAYFFAGTEKELAHTIDLTAMRATTVMVVPEVPIGTLTILLTMLAGLAIFARKRL